MGQPPKKPTETGSQKRRWTTTRNLWRPYSTKNDGRYSRRAIERGRALPQDSSVSDFWQRKYRGAREILSIEKEYNDVTSSWAFYLQICGKEIERKIIMGKILRAL